MPATICRKPIFLALGMDSFPPAAWPAAVPAAADESVVALLAVPVFAEPEPEPELESDPLESLPQALAPTANAPIAASAPVRPIHFLIRTLSSNPSLTNRPVGGHTLYPGARLRQ